MRILDASGNELTEAGLDLTAGKLENETLTIHHEAVEGVEEVGHYETIAEYPNGGKDVRWVVDTPGQEATDAWDEEEEIQRYTPYTEEELAEQAAAEEALAEKMQAAELRDEKIEALLSAIACPEKPSEMPSRPGYKWKLAYTWGSSSMAWEEVEDPDAQGTADSPIEWESGMAVYANYFYTAAGVRYLCVADGAPTEITNEYFEQF